MEKDQSHMPVDSEEMPDKKGISYTELLPVKILKNAIKAVPAVRYALGIAGVAAAVSIVAGLGMDYRVAVFGTLIMFGLMFILVMFSSFAKESRKTTRPFALVLSWAFLVLTILASVFLMTSSSSR